MSNYNVYYIVNRDTVWTVTSLEFVRLLRLFLNEKALLMEMCAAAKYKQNVAWFVQTKDKTVDMFKVVKAGCAKCVVHGDTIIRDKSMRIYESHYSTTKEIIPTMVIDSGTVDINKMLFSYGIKVINKSLVGYNTPLNNTNEVGSFELLFSTDESGTTIVKMPYDHGLQIPFTGPHEQHVVINGSHGGLFSNIKVMRKDVLEISANPDILDVIKQNNIL